MNASFFEELQAVREIVAQEPSNEVVGKLGRVLDDKDVFREFWRMLDRPNWILPLCRAGYFAGATAGEKETWPPSDYLKRMAAHEPKLVARILAGVETVNPNILADMIQAALKMPPQIAAPLAGRIGSLLGQGTELYMFRQKAFCQLVERLAGESSTQEQAFGLAEVYLFPRVKPETRNQRRDEHNFLRALEPLVPMMVRLRPEETIRLLCGRLVEAIRAKGEPASGEPLFDYSYMWRPAIEEHKQNRTYDATGMLVTPLRNGAEIAVREKHVVLEDVLRIVRSFKYMIFQRLAVHLINVFAEQEPGLVRKTIMEKELFKDYRFKHEYALLVGRRFDLLKPTEKDRFFAWIEDGPDMSGFDDSVRSNLTREPTDQDRENRKHYWQYERVWWIRGHLGKRWKQFFDKMHAEHGDPELADLNVRTDLSWGSKSPIDGRDLEGLSFSEALEKVLSWRPSEHERGERLVDGLQDAFAAYVKQNVKACSHDAELMIRKPAMFVRPFISTMQEAVNEGKPIKFEPVFELCRWVVQQPREQDTRPFPTEKHDLVDPDWQWCRDRIVDFVSTCCKKPVSLKHRESLWDILQPLTHDPDTDYISSTREQEDIRFRDFLDQSLNNPRAHAVNAIFGYVQWVADHMKAKKEGRDVVPGGFNTMREVRQALEEGLQSGEHDTFSVRAIYGRHLGMLYLVDKEWLVSRVDQLFDLDKIETDPGRAHGWAAWNAFLVCIPPHIEYFNLLEKQFKYAVNQYRNIAVKKGSPYQAPARCGEHLIVLYGRGQLELDDHDSLLRRFLSNSCQVIRSHAISFVGQTLGGEEDETREPLPREVVDRFVKLWEWYWPEVGSRDEEPSRDLFSWWYTSRCFDRRWALARLWDYVQRVSLPEPDFHLSERLAEDAELDPKEALSIMEKMIEADKEGWRVGGWEAEIKQILSLAMKADKATRAQAVGLINRWGRKGWISLGELLRATQT